MRQRSVRLFCRARLSAISANCNADGFGRVLNVNGHNWSTISELEPYKNNYYDALQAKLTRQLKGGSVVGVAYTFSKAIDYTDNDDLNGSFENLPQYYNLNRSLASFDRTHNLQIYAVYINCRLAMDNDGRRAESAMRSPAVGSSTP